ncbi:MAG: aminotransferase class V-fold PLP-dependent enzyme [bacterium]
MIYLNQAATSHPKPETVYQAVDRCLRGECGTNSRSNAHDAADYMVYQTREKLAKLFNIPYADRIVFTLNATEAINLALFGLLNPGDHVITTSMEHNAVTRALFYLQTHLAVSVTKIPGYADGNFDPQEIKKAIQPKTKLIVMTHASNVTGTLYPIAEVGELAQDKVIYFMVDAAQTAGNVGLDVQKAGIDILAFPGHKGLFGPPGIGGIYVAKGISLRPLKYGGTGSHSDLASMPEMMPDKFESGTPNLPGIAGLHAGAEFILQTGLTRIQQHELELTEYFLEEAANINQFLLYGSKETKHRVATVSFNILGCDPMEVGHALQEIYGIVCRAGLHCSPDAHKTIGTFPAGTVRVSFGYFNTKQEIELLLSGLQQIAKLGKPNGNNGLTRKIENNGSMVFINK